MKHGVNNGGENQLALKWQRNEIKEIIRKHNEM
jgi:hypothetical protein